jgi:hypothetical protein
MDIEKQIQERINSTGYSRLDVIASMNLGKRSEAAQRASQNRTRRKELMEAGMNFETACLVVNKENERKYNNTN